MKHVDLYGRVRHAVLIDGMSRREAARFFGINRRTVDKMLTFSIPPGYRRDKEIRRPKLDGFTGIIDQILEADKLVPKKQRHTSKRIFERLERGMASGELRDDLSEVHAWAIMGMNVFLGLKFSLWSETDRSDEVAAAANLLMREGIAAPASKDPE